VNTTGRGLNASLHRRAAPFASWLDEGVGYGGIPGETVIR
jgi:hypothetical protein